MQFHSIVAAAAAAALCAVAPAARAQTAAPSLTDRLVVPQSSLVRAEDTGLRAHTNVRYARVGQAVSPDKVPFPGYLYESPASLACIYGLAAKASGCNPNVVTKNASGGSRVVAIVDAYDDPSALSDLQSFSKQFGLPAVSGSNFQVVYASGHRPPYDSGWQVEEALDVEMVHALAPKAKIILVEAASNSYVDLLKAEKVAAQKVAAAGGGEVSNSWGGREFSGETSTTYTGAFAGSKVVFFASTGDDGYQSFPAVYSNIVAVGGTSTQRNSSTGAFIKEVTWTSAGAGPSTYFARPSYQSGVSSVVGTKRSVPDVALDANPDTGVWIYVNGDWNIVGGTSVSAPLMAAVTNAAGHFAASTASELATIYSKAHAQPGDFHDITSGACGTNKFYHAATGFDHCVGNGSPANLLGE